MIRTSFVRVTGLLAFSLLQGCADHSHVRKTIGAHSFDIPQQYVVSANVFYLPASQKTGLTLVMNPTAPSDKQILVGLDPATACPRAYNAAPENDRCKAVGAPVELLGRETLERVPSPLGDIWWTYRTVRSRLNVAACTLVSGTSDALCVSYGLYKDLPYTMHLRDSQMRHLVSIRGQIEQKLTEWEVPH